MIFWIFKSITPLQIKFYNKPQNPKYLKICIQFQFNYILYKLYLTFESKVYYFTANIQKSLSFFSCFLNFGYKIHFGTLEFSPILAYLVSKLQVTVAIRRRTLTRPLYVGVNSLAYIVLVVYMQLIWMYRPVTTSIASSSSIQILHSSEYSRRIKYDF